MKTPPARASGKLSPVAIRHVPRLASNLPLHDPQGGRGHNSVDDDILDAHPALSAAIVLLITSLTAWSTRSGRRR